MKKNFKWRCLLCDRPAWTRGNYDDWMNHYKSNHYEQKENM